MRVRRALTATTTVALLVLSLAACSHDGASPDIASTSAAADTVGGTSAEPATEVDHTVPGPGPREPGLLAPADILVVSATTIDADTLKAINELKHVTAMAISLSEPVIENKSLAVAAVDPGEYRSFTPPKYAAFQEAWDRVAGGELALKQRMKGKVPADENGYLRLGAAADAPTVHVGAFVQQQPFIDAVVNKTWVETLGMTPDNALLVRTGSRAPATVKEKLAELLPPDTAVTLVDKATRFGVDPDEPQVAIVTGTVADAVGVFRYTVLGGGRIAPDPAWVSSQISTEAVPILGTVTCNKLIFPQLRAALEEVIRRGLADKIHPDEYAGCYYPRFIAGSSTLSNHAFGLALDLNVPGNGRGTVGEMDRGVVDAFKQFGFAWGGDWGYTDPMHFEMAQLVNPS
jgi:hypothetical protein